MGLSEGEVGKTDGNRLNKTLFTSLDRPIPIQLTHTHTHTHLFPWHRHTGRIRRLALSFVVCGNEGKDLATGHRGVEWK